MVSSGFTVAPYRERNNRIIRRIDIPGGECRKNDSYRYSKTPPGRLHQPNFSKANPINIFWVFGWVMTQPNTL
jgi:hypothetical protein